MPGIGKRSRRNAKGVKQAMNQSLLFKLGPIVRRDSDTTFPTGSPITNQENVGFDVKDWGSIHTVIYPSYAVLGATNYQVRIRPWRYYDNLDRDRPEGVVKGQWIKDVDVVVPLNNLSDQEGTQHLVWETRNADKMYIELVETIVNDPAHVAFNVEAVFIQSFGYTDKSAISVNSPSPSTTLTVSAEGGSTTVNVAPDVVSDRSIYSTNDSIWTATYLSATTLTLAAGANFPDILAEQILAVMYKREGAGSSETTDLYRGINLACTYDAITGILTVPTAAFNVADNFAVYWEDYPKAINVVDKAPFDDGTALIRVNQGGGIGIDVLPAAVDNNDVSAIVTDLYGRTMLASHQLLTQSDRVEEINPLNEKEVIEELIDDETIDDDTTLYYPSEAGGTLENYAQLSFQYHLVGGVTVAGANVTMTVTIETNFDGDGAAGRWVDITKAGYLPEDDETVGAAGASAIVSVGVAANDGEIDFDEIRGLAYRVKITFSAIPTSAGGGTYAEAVIHAQRMVM